MGGGSETWIIQKQRVLHCECDVENQGGGKGPLIQIEQSGTLGTNNDQCVIKEYVARRLTPTECARLQGFPDDWCADVLHSDSAEYKLWGNGIALPCVIPLLLRVKKVLERENMITFCRRTR